MCASSPSENVTIYADKREAASRIAEILKKHCIVKEETLEVADYILSGRIAVERKTSSDFINSIVDRRLFRQLASMKKNFERPVIIIEGNALFESNIRVKHNAIRGALASIVADYGIPVLNTGSQLETAKMLYRIAYREQVKNYKPAGLRVKRKMRSKNHMQEFLIEGFPGISAATAKKLLRHFGSPHGIFAASEKELQEADGIGKETAGKIRQILTAKYEKSILED